MCLSSSSLRDTWFLHHHLTRADRRALWPQTHPPSRRPQVLLPAYSLQPINVSRHGNYARLYHASRVLRAPVRRKYLQIQLNHFKLLTSIHSARVLLCTLTWSLRRKTTVSSPSPSTIKAGSPRQYVAFEPYAGHHAPLIAITGFVSFLGTEHS